MTDIPDTDTGSPTLTIPTESALEIFKRETQEQFKALRDSFESSNKEKDSKIAQLTEDNKGLQKALLIQATQPVTAEKAKTPEELYKEQINALSKRTLDIMVERRR